MSPLLPLAATTEQTPFINYLCPCGYSVTEETTTTTDNDNHLVPPVHPRSPLAPFASFPLAGMYFCEDCNRIRCPRCVQEEVVCYYCPNCLFEVPNASIRSEKNRCTRNCFACPVCASTLQVVGNESGRDPTAATKGPYRLLCGVCRWDSKETGLEFEKPTGLALLMQREEDERADAKEFDKLKIHMESHFRNMPLSLQPTAFSGLPSSTIFAGGYGKSSMLQQRTAQTPSDLPPYHSTGGCPDEDSAIANLITNVDLAEVSTLQQRLRQPSDQPYTLSNIRPQRIHLRSKRSKRCRSCRHMLIKPEQKAQSTRFRIKMIAMNYIPSLTLARTPTLKVGQRSRVVLMFTNPLYQEIDVRLAIGPLHDSKTEISHSDPVDRVNLTASQFIVAAYSDTWEYEDEDDGQDINQNDPSVTVTRNGNTTGVVLEVVPGNTTDPVIFPLSVTYTYVLEDPPTTEPPELTESSTETAKTAKEVVESETRSHCFWVAVGLGLANLPWLPNKALVKDSPSARSAGSYQT